MGGCAGALSPVKSALLQSVTLLKAEFGCKYNFEAQVSGNQDKLNGRREDDIVVLCTCCM